jgi:hypothetical protein
MVGFVIPLVSGLITGAAKAGIANEEKDAAAIQEQLKAAYTERSERKKEIDTQRNEATKVVNSLRGIEFADGTLDNSQLINIASKPDLAKSILKKLDDDPEWFKKTSKGFVRQVEGVDPTTDIAKYFKEVYTLQKEAAANAETFYGVNNEDAGFFDKMKASRQLRTARQTAAKLGVSLDDLLSTYKPTSAIIRSQGSVDPSALAKPKDWNKVESEVQSNLFEAQRSGDPERIAKADADMGRVILVKEKMRLNQPEADIRSDLVNEIQALDKAGKTDEANNKRALLKQRQMLLDKADGETKVTQANFISVANKAVEARMQSLIPGKFISTVGLDGTVTMQPKGIDDKGYKGALAKSRNEVIADFTTKDGKPKSDLHKNALTSIGVNFDADGIVVKSEPTSLSAQDLTPAAPAAPATPAASAASTPAAPAKPAASAPAPAASATRVTPLAQANADTNRLSILQQEIVGAQSRLDTVAKGTDKKAIERAQADVAGLQREIDLANKTQKKNTADYVWDQSKGAFVDPKTGKIK